MNIVDIIILLVLIGFAIVGFKRGVLESLVSFVGFILVIYLAYLFKDYLGNIFLLNLPFFTLKAGSNASVVMNVIMYQLLAFVIIVILLSLVYRLIVTLSGIIEKILKMTVILSIPSKILGLVVGLLEGYIFIYLVLFLIVQPYVKNDFIAESKYVKTIVNKTPILSGFASGTLEIINEVETTMKDIDSKDFDLKLADLVLKEKVVSPDIMQQLVDNKKIKVDGIEQVIQKYKTEENIED